jgi:glucose-1-phosphate thymidylyltransferase
MAGIKELAVVSDSMHLEDFKRLLGTGKHLGVAIEFIPQAVTNGIVGALQSASDFIGSDSALVILGDNIYFGGGIGASLNEISDQDKARIWVKQVSNPQDYGIINFDDQGVPIEIAEKPSAPKSNMAVTGLYYLPSEFVSHLAEVKASSRNELEITSLLSIYLKEQRLNIENLNRGTAWFDAGSPDRLFMSADFVRIIQERTGQIVGSPEEVSYRNKLISSEEFKGLILGMPSSQYRDTLLETLQGKKI